MSPELLSFDDDEDKATTPYLFRMSAACIDQSSLLSVLQLDGRVTDIVSVSIFVAIVTSAAMAMCRLINVIP
jgi:hypothetical protein